jgi:hypothetical protein
MRLLSLVFLMTGIGLGLLGCATSTPTTNKSVGVQPLIFDSCIEGTTRQGFINATTSGDIPCAQGIQTCTSGMWHGPILFPSCDNFTKSCGGSPHGSVVTGYLQPTSPHGVPCMTTTRTCIDGNWTGPEIFPSCSEL